MRYAFKSGIFDKKTAIFEKFTVHNKETNFFPKEFYSILLILSKCFVEMRLSEENDVQPYDAGALAGRN
jgi:hypothetical protein